MDKSKSRKVEKSTNRKVDKSKSRKVDKSKDGHVDLSTFRHVDFSLRHVAIRASAGSGKTFQLTNRYLQLIAAGAEPSSILASTFTRLAAGQIRDRILTRLAEAAEDQGKCEDLAEHLELPGLTRERVVAILARLARQMHVMQIRTLDSFFAAIVRAFAIELQIPIGAEVIDEEQAAALRAQAIQLMLDEHDPQRLIDLLRLLTQGASDRAITSRIDSTVRDLYDLWRESQPQAWECVPQPPGRLPPPQLVDAIKRLEEAACPPSDRWLGVFQKDCENARNWRWSEFLSKGLAAAIADGSNTYSRKAIPDELVKAYVPVVRHAIAELIGRVREQTIATRDLLALFHVQYERIKRQRRAITFSDLAGAMIRAQKAGGFDEISFRLDAKLAHLLLDEFQDTSIAQWNALEPLAREAASVAPPEKSFFCVGDVKQSIYRWRDAAPEVLDEIPNLLPGLEIRTLAKSYRSAPQIMEAVNQVFSSIQSNAALVDHPDAAEAWAKGFEHHETAKNDLPGYVELRVCQRAGEDEQANVLRLRAAAELAAELHRSNPHMSIAVLTHTNRAVGRLLYELGPSRLNVPGGVSGRGGGPLNDAAPVNVILDLLQLADHPDDTVAAFNVAMAPVVFDEIRAEWPATSDEREATSVERRMSNDERSMPASQESSRRAHHSSPEGSANWWSDGGVRRRIARAIRRSLLDHGYGATVSRWMRAIAEEGACDARELRRLRELVTLADAFDRNKSLRTGDFIALVEQTRIADIQPAAVQVMTIHQAKGLEFDAVILAELESKLTGEGTPSVIVERGAGVNAIGPVTRICRYMNKDLVEFAPEFKPLFDHHTRRVVRESLSVLYVAMTRAVHGLYMIINPPQINKNGSLSTRDLKTLAGVVRCALSRDDASPDSIAFTLGDPNWHQRIAQPAASAAAEPQTLPSIQLALRTGPDHWRGSAAAPASQTAETDLALARQLRLPDREARDRGTALHALFEHIEWIEDFASDEQALVRVIRARTPRRDQTWAHAQARAFLKFLDAPAVRAILSRGNIDPSRCQVRREHPFVRLSQGDLQRGTMDRLVLQQDHDCRITAAMIIDFKTDACSPDDIAQLVEHYRPQMSIYRQAVAEAFSLDGANIAARLVFAGPGVVVDL